METTDKLCWNPERQPQTTDRLITKRFCELPVLPSVFFFEHSSTPISFRAERERGQNLDAGVR